MKKEDADAAENSENVRDRQASAEADQAKAKSAQAQKDRKELDGVRLPVLVEFVYTVSAIFIVFLALAMMAISFFKGASLFDLVVRTSVAVVVVGGLLMWLASQISSGALSASILEQEETQQPAPEETRDAQSVSEA